MNIISFSTGVGIAWTSPSIPKLNNLTDQSENPLGAPITYDEESWLTSLFTLGVSMGAFLFGFLSDKIGHKKSIIIATIPLTICYILQAFSTNINYFFIARFIGGFGSAAVFTVVPTYIAEISDDSNRGTLGCCMPVMLTVANLFTFCVGPYTSIMTFNAINIVPPILCAVLTTFFVPNSPYYSVQHDDIVNAENTIQKLKKHSSTADVKAKIDVIIKACKSTSNLIDVFSSKASKRGIVITCSLMFFQQFSGISVLLSYMQLIFGNADSNMPPEISTMIIGLVSFCCCFLSQYFIDKLGRKILLCISLLGTCFANVLLGFFFFYKNEHVFDSCKWLVILSLIVFMMCYNFGIGPVPWAVLGELFSSELKAKASTITTFVCFLLAFFTNFAFPYVKVYVGYAETFWFFSVYCAVGFLFVLFFVPETKNKSMNEILTLLNGSRL